MKVLIIGFAKIKYMAYAKFYMEQFCNGENEVHVAYWNRDLKEEDLSNYKDVVFHEFRRKQKDEKSKFSKIFNFLRFKRFAEKVIKKGNYDRIVVMHSIASVLLSKTLSKKYKGKFIFDYRDYTYEKFSFFKKKIAKLVKDSYATFTSSDGYRQFMPSEYQDKIFTSHNLLEDTVNHRNEKIDNPVPSSKIRIAFWGFIRAEKLNCLIIDRLANDDRFELHYYGRVEKTAIALKMHAEEIGATNVFFHGEYKPEDRYRFARETDIIHNIYWDANTKYAMGCKSYDGVMFYLPQVCHTGSVMGSFVEDNKVGIQVDPEKETFADDIYNYYKNLSQQEFMENCDRILDKILAEFKQGQQVLSDFVKP